MNQDTGLNRVIRSLVNLESTDPFFASVSLNLKLVEDRSVPTACTDGKHLNFNPDYIMSKSRDYVDIVMVHEIVHVILGHPILLLKLPDKQRALIAMELSDNSLICHRKGFPVDGILLPGRGDYVNLPLGKNTEWYYNELKKQDDDGSERDVGDIAGDGNGDKEEPGGNDSDDSEAEADGKDSGSTGDMVGDEDERKDEKDAKSPEGQGGTGEASKSTDKHESDAKTGTHNTTSDSTVRPVETQTGVIGEVKPYKFEEGETEAEVERKWESIISQSANDAASAGNMPGEFEELVTKILGVKPLPWPTILRQFLVRNIRRGRSFRRPNRRTCARDDIAPSRLTKGLGKLVFGVDVSGSMDIYEMNKALAVCIDIGKLYRDFELGIVQFDTNITAQNWFTRFDSNNNYFKDWNWKGRGGTSYKAFFEQITKFRADVIVIVTDGWPNDGWPDMRLIHTPVIWLITKETDVPKDVSRYSKVININDDQP